MLGDSLPTRLEASIKPHPEIVRVFVDHDSGAEPFGYLEHTSSPLPTIAVPKVRFFFRTIQQFRNEFLCHFLIVSPSAAEPPGDMPSALYLCGFSKMAGPTPSSRDAPPGHVVFDLKVLTHMVGNNVGMLNAFENEVLELSK